MLTAANTSQLPNFQLTCNHDSENNARCTCSCTHCISTAPVYFDIVDTVRDVKAVHVEQVIRTDMRVYGE